MQDNQSLFSLNIDPEIKAHLSDTAKWARFLSIVGMILLALFAVGNILGMGFSSAFSPVDTEYGTGMATQLRVVMVILSIVLIAIVFFPLLFLYRFAVYMKKALIANDQEALSEAFLNVKRYFRYLGILVIVMLAFYALVFVIFIVGFAAFGG